jgi:hypothetical protein
MSTDAYRNLVVLTLLFVFFVIFFTAIFFFSFSVTSISTKLANVTLHFGRGPHQRAHAGRLGPPEPTAFSRISRRRAAYLQNCRCGLSTLRGTEEASSNDLPYFFAARGLGALF